MESRPFVLMALVTLMGLFPSGAAVNGPELGKAAPPLHLANLLQAPANASATWEAFRGRVIVIDFWATWCGPCVKSLPHWNELADSFKGKPVQYLAITDENEQVVTAFLRRMPIHSWVGLDGAGQSTRDLYRIEGIPTTIIVNQQGLVVAVTHPTLLQAKHLAEVIETGTSSLPPPAEPVAGADAEVESMERVPARRPAFEVSARLSGPLPPGHGSDGWESSPSSSDASCQFSSVRQAILTLFNCKQPLLDCRATLPKQQYDFVVRLPPTASRADREQAVLPMFRSVFGIQIRRVQTEREVFVLRVASTNPPGLTASRPQSVGGGGEESGGLRLGRATIDWLPRYLEQWLRKPVFNETGLTNRYDIRLRWKMSKTELLPYAIDRQVLAAVEKPDPAKEVGLSNHQRRQVTAILGEPSEADAQMFSAEERGNIELLRAEFAKPDKERFRPDPEAIIAAVREQLGLAVSVEHRVVPVLIVEREESSK